MVGSGDNYYTRYLHLKEVFVEVGERVEEGQIIGLSGNEGCSTEPHLHFDVSKRNVSNNAEPPVFVDPNGWCGEGTDPWEQLSGEKSIRLWKTD